MKVQKNERKIRGKREIEAEIRQWDRKIMHAWDRLEELDAKQETIHESKRGLLMGFIERLDSDIEWFKDEKALCECELRGRED